VPKRAVFAAFQAGAGDQAILENIQQAPARGVEAADLGDMHPVANSTDKFIFEIIAIIQMPKQEKC